MDAQTHSHLATLKDIIVGIHKHRHREIQNPAGSSKGSIEDLTKDFGRQTGGICRPRH